MKLTELHIFISTVVRLDKSGVQLVIKIVMYEKVIATV